MGPGWPRLERCSAPLYPSLPLHLPPPAIISVLSPAHLSLHLPVPPPLQPPLRHGSEEPNLQLSSPAVLPFPFFFINYWSRRAWREGPWRGTRLTNPAVLLNDNVAARPACPPPLSNRMAAARPGSNDILSVAEGAIGKQRLKMNYPVSSSSLMNK